jgi:Subtilase family
LLPDADAAALERARAAGFVVIDSETVEGLDLTVTRLTVPAGMSLAKAQARLEALLPGAEVSADTLHFASGGTGGGRAGTSPAPAAAIATPVGVIDGAAAAGLGVTATRGFAAGAPRPSDHGSAVVGLLAGAGVKAIRVADVYGADPAGGNALAIARALGWQVESGSKVVSISLVGPANPVLARAVAAAQRRGVVVVAAVGNDGPAAPPAYPASYPGVVAVTGVDRRDRVLIESGRALHLDYAAPGADLAAPNAAGRPVRLRGTSYAAPLVAARLAAALDQTSAWQHWLDREARDLGPRGADKAYGRGLVCGTCRPPR